MFDRVWQYTALLRIDGTTYHRCAESRATTPRANVIEGDWEVVAHHEPGISAMSTAEADQWIGRKARYSAESAQFGEQRCSSPSYDTTSLTADAFFQNFRVPPKALDLPVVIQVIEVRCAGRWNGPGSRLFVKRPNAVLTFWDGVFFELRR